jgi:hypothetical protein
MAIAPSKLVEIREEVEVWAKPLFRYPFALLARHTHALSARRHALVEAISRYWKPSLEETIGLGSRTHLDGDLFGTLSFTGETRVTLDIRDYCDGGPSDSFGIVEVEPSYEEYVELKKANGGSYPVVMGARMDQLNLCLNWKEFDGLLRWMVAIRDQRDRLIAEQLKKLEERRNGQQRNGSESPADSGPAGE